MDYLPEIVNVTFKPGRQTAQVTISIVNDNNLEMATETILMVLNPSQGNASNVCVTTPETATLRIMYDDGELEAGPSSQRKPNLSL